MIFVVVLLLLLLAIAICFAWGLFVCAVAILHVAREQLGEDFPPDGAEEEAIAWAVADVKRRITGRK